VGRQTAREALDARWAGRAPRFSRLLRAVGACVRAACPGWVTAELPEAVAPARAAVPPVLHLASARSRTGALQETCGAMPQGRPPASGTHPACRVPTHVTRMRPRRLPIRLTASVQQRSACPGQVASETASVRIPNPPWPTPSSELGEAGLSHGSRQIPQSPSAAGRETDSDASPRGRGRVRPPRSGSSYFKPAAHILCISREAVACRG
jgi:hypothetical protein